MKSAPKHLHTKFVIPAFFAGVLLFGVSSIATKAEGFSGNPIGAVARLFNPKLVKVEDRVEFLSRQLITLARHEEHFLKTGLGCRGVKQHASDPDPYVVIDLGKEYPIEELFLVPLQGEFTEKNSIFPKRFTLEFSSKEDFSEKRILYKSGDHYFPDTGGKPVKFSGQGGTARFIRLTINQGQLRGSSEIFGLSEIVVISDRYPVSFGCEVSGSGTVSVECIWYPETLTDGRMPLGIWEGGHLAPLDSRGELVDVAHPDEEVCWSISLDEAAKLDLMILYPYSLRDVMEAGVLPEKLEVQVRNGSEEEFRTVMVWESEMHGTNHEVPLVLNCKGVSADEVRIVGMMARHVGDKFLHGLSEIEIWSEHKNISAGLTVNTLLGGEETDTKILTDSFTSERSIIAVGTWLNQLHDRWRVEREIEALQPMRNQMSAESELNATWGSAMMLGLTFLIPVFIVERRRLISRNQIDQLRKRIASDLHDDIGSNLGSISLIARTARKDLVRLHGPDVVAEDLGEMESIARESSLAMRDIVWLLERKQDSIGDLVQRMRETAGRMLREFDYSIECDSTKTASKLSLDAKRHLFLFYKEAIHNVIKHSGASSVSIRLWDERDNLALEVIDNGKGLPKVTEKGKESLKRVRKLDERARVLDGSIVFASSPDSGTRVLLTVKRSLLISAPATK
ncbi:MAG: sensor histidine kinase [Luteolibacter sp.]